jgi:hypothetical protein
VRFYVGGSGFFGNGESYLSPVVENPTWLQVAIIANDAICATESHHHVFLEGISLVKRVKDGAVYALLFGS